MGCVAVQSRVRRGSLTPPMEGPQVSMGPAWTLETSGQAQWQGRETLPRRGAGAQRRRSVAPRPPPPAPPLQGGEGSLAAYVVRCSCDTGPNGDIRRTVVDHVGLFPVSQNVRWTYAVHEQILPALRQAKVPVHWTDITVRHTGYSDPALRQRRLERDRKILEA